MKKIALATVLLVSTTICGQNNSNTQTENVRQTNTQTENIVVQMNYCINTLTNIIHNKSMPLLEHESNQLVNNLTMEQIIGLPEISDFRISLMDAVSKFSITEEEKALMRRIQSMKRDNMKWAALSNALNPAMLVTGGGDIGPQTAFQVLLTAARSTVEYKTMQGEQSIEELQAMWELRKSDLQTINELRKSAYEIVFNLYSKYALNENDRLTESTANMFCEYISEPQADKRIRILKDNFQTYKQIPSYYYYLGAAYLDEQYYSKAKENFIIYRNMYKRAPILRYDEKSGSIALSMLTYERNLSDIQKEELIGIALNNLPSNSAAILQCAMVYIYDLKQPDEGFHLLRAGIDDPKASDRDLLFMAASNLLQSISKNRQIYNAICAQFERSNSVSFDSYVTFLINTKLSSWAYINKDFKLSIKKYTFSTKKDICLDIPKKITFNFNDVDVYMETHDDNEFSIFQLSPTFVNSITEKKVNEVDCFKSNKYLKYLFVEELDDNTYKLKKGIDVNSIKNESFPRMSEFMLSKDDIDDIVEFCKDHQASECITKICFSKIDCKKKIISNNNGHKIVFFGNQLSYKPKALVGDYVRFVFKNGIELIYKFKGDLLELYMYKDRKNYHFTNRQDKYTSKNRALQINFWWRKQWNKTLGLFPLDCLYS